MTKELAKLEFWDTAEYKERLAEEWTALGMIDPLQYKGKEAWQEALDHERQIKDYIYEIRETDAAKNKYICDRTGVRKYLPGYSPISWRSAQARAFKKYGKPDIKYMYSPLSTPNINDYYFNYKIADTWCDWIEAHICHVEGELADQLVLLTLEQRSFFRTIFGWKKKADKLRRYSEIFKYIPRKNSKTFDLAALALGVMTLDKEGGCKVVSVATCLDQAIYAYAPAKAIIEKSRDLQIDGGQLASHFKAYKRGITANNDLDSFKPIAFNDSSAHGGNFHVSILDEVHEQEDDSMYNVCVTSQGARRQPMIVMITTASTAEENFCNRKLAVSKSICRNSLVDDTFLPILYYANEKEFNDDWNDEQVWIRTNPMYGLAKKPNYIAKMNTKANNEPHFENSFKRLEINMVTASDSAAYHMVHYNNCKQNMRTIKHDIIEKQEVPEILLGAKCYAGLDLASKNDLCALTLEFPDTNWMLSWSFIPEKHKKIKDMDRFLNRINFCGDEIIDFKLLRKSFLHIMSFFNVVQLGFDLRFATELIQGIQEESNIDVIEVPQSAMKLNEPTVSTIDSVLGEELKHNGCILQLWQFNNCVTRENKDECIQIQKTGTNSSKKIDAVAAWVNARALRIANEDEDSLTDRYNNTGSYF